MKPDDIRHLIHGEFDANQKSSARTNTKKTTIWSIGWIGVDRFEGVWHPNFINPLEYEKSFHNQLSLPQAQLFVPAPPTVTTGYAQTNRPGQIGLNQYYDYCRCQRNGWTPDFEKVLCMVTTPPPLTNQRLNTLTFLQLRGGAVQRIFWGVPPSNKIGKCRQKANSCRCKKCFYQTKLDFRIVSREHLGHQSSGVFFLY